MTATAPVRERPILFSALMVREVLAGRKTQTRRVVTPQPPFAGDVAYASPTVPGAWNFRSSEHRGAGLSNLPVRCSYGQPGDRLWVRENGWQPKEPSPRELREGADTWPKYAYDADGIGEAEAEAFREWGWKRRPSIHMPRWASRITLELADVRIERLRNITDADALAEGCYADDPEPPHALAPKTAFSVRWQELNGDRGFGWDVNPWVWVIGFRRVT